MENAEVRKDIGRLANRGDKKTHKEDAMGEEDDIHEEAHEQKLGSFYLAVMIAKHVTTTGSMMMEA